MLHILKAGDAAPRLGALPETLYWGLTLAPTRYQPTALADLINEATGLTPEEVELLWAAAPPRTPMGERVVLVSLDAPLEWRSECGRYTVHLDAQLLSKIVEIARHHLPNEVGSSLSGYYTEDGVDAYVLGTAPVPPDSSGSRTTFKRGVEGLKIFFSSLTGSRGLRQHYVGEWHSHPTGGACPSSTDVNSGMDIACDEDGPCKEINSVILGNIGSPTPDLSVSVYSASNGAVMLSRARETD